MTNTRVLYDQLDALHTQSLDKIKKIVEAADSIDANLEESVFEAKRTELAQEAFDCIHRYNEYLQIAKSKNQEGIDSKLSTYIGKSRELNEKLKNAQIQSSEAANEIIHRKRMEKFCTRKPLKEEQIRAELFGETSKENFKKNSKLNAQSSLLEKNKSITASLQATRQMMATSIMHTELNIDTIEQQTKDVSALNDKYTDFNQLLNRSKAIIKFIQRQDKQDKHRIYLSLGFLFIVCCWVIWRRLLKMPIKILLWSMFKVFGLANWAVSSKDQNINHNNINGVGHHVATTQGLMQDAQKTDIIMEQGNNVGAQGDIQSWEEVVDEELRKMQTVDEQIHDEL